jgi:tetratricopeptide (TPR) repeat protein
MSFVLFTFLSFIPTIDILDPVAYYEAKTKMFLEKGEVDSAEYYAEIYLKKAQTLKQKKQALFLQYHINKKQRDIEKTEESYYELLKIATLQDSLQFTRDYMFFLYNTREYERIVVFQTPFADDDSINFVVALALVRVGRIEEGIELLKTNNLTEGKILRTYLLHSTGKYRDALELSRTIQWYEMFVISAGALGIWDSVRFLQERLSENSNTDLGSYLQVIYILALRNLSLEVPFEVYQKWITTYSSHPLKDYVKYLYSVDLNKQGKWLASNDILSSIDTLTFFEGYPDFKVNYYWVKGKNCYFSSGSLREITKNLLFVAENARSNELRDSCYYYLAYTYQRFSQYKKALDYFGRISESSPFFVSSLYNTARIYHKQNENAKAKEIIEKALNMNVEPDFKVRFLELKAEIHEAEKEYSKAINVYNSILKLDVSKAKSYEIYYNIEILKFKRGDYDSVEQAYFNYIIKYPESPLVPQIYFDLTFKYVYTKDKASAKRILNDMISRYPLSLKTIDALALYFNSPLAALEDTTMLNDYKRKNPKNLDETEYIKGALFSKFGMYDEALKYYGNVKSGRYLTEAQMRAMEIYFNLKKYYEVEVTGMEILPDEIKDFSSYKIVEYYLKALKIQGKNETFNNVSNYYISKEFPFKKDYCLMLSDLYIKEKDTLNAIKCLLMATTHNATATEIAKYNPELLKLLEKLK